MGRGRPAQRVKLSTADRRSLEAQVRRGTEEQRDVFRARIALLANRGDSTEAIAESLHTTVQTVSLWRGRVARSGLAGLVEQYRSGRPRRITPAERLQVISLACEPAEAGGRSTPTLDELVERSVERGVVSQISRSHLHRILVAGDLRPHRVQQWLHSPDPAFREKVNVICDLYRKAPKDSVVLSIDEKTSIQAVERKHLDRPPLPGRFRRQEFEYIRHGTQTLIAALDVHTGRTVSTCGDTRTQADLLAFMEQVATAYPAQNIHVIWDNLNTHRSGVWTEFNERHGKRFRFHFTPIHASWVNQVELLFGVYTRRALRNASHTSKAHLKARTEAFFAKRNANPKPFKWSFRGYNLQTGEPKGSTHAKTKTSQSCP
jgi:transposase